MNLPEDVLHHLYGIMSASDATGPAPGMCEDAMAPSQIHTSETQALRCCCKRLQTLSNSLRKSIAFSSHEQPQVEQYLRKLPLLNRVTIKYSNNLCDVQSSLQSLFSILSHLDSLTLHDQTYHTNHPLSEVKPIVSFSPGVWGKSITNLELHDMSYSQLIPPEDTSQGMLSSFPVLKRLSMHSMNSVLKTDDIVGHASLQALILCGYSCVAKLDVASCSSLQVLSVTSSFTTQLNVSGLRSLRVLECRNNRISSLDVSTCPALEKLECSRNSITKLDLTANLKLQELLCSGNPVSTLLLPKCPAHLTHLHCNECTFTQLDLSACTALHTLNMEGTLISTVNLKGCRDLRYMSVRCSKHLLMLDLSNLDRLTYVGLGKSEMLGVLDVSGCTALDTLSCEHSAALSSLCLSGCKNLKTLHLNGCGLQALSLSGCPRLRHLKRHGCPLNFLDVSMCLELDS